MENIFKYPQKREWENLLKRSALNKKDLKSVVEEIFLKVEKDGDKALNYFSRKFDSLEIDDLKVTQTEIEEAQFQISDELKVAIKQAKSNIEKFHVSQQEKIREIETMKGVFLLARITTDRKLRFIHSGWNCSAFLNGLNVGCSCSNCGL